VEGGDAAAQPGLGRLRLGEAAEGVGVGRDRFGVAARAEEAFGARGGLGGGGGRVRRAETREGVGGLDVGLRDRGGVEVEAAVGAEGARGVAGALVRLRGEQEGFGVVGVGQFLQREGDARPLARLREEARGAQGGFARARGVGVVAREFFEGGARFRRAAELFEVVGAQPEGVVGDRGVALEVGGLEERGGARVIVGRGAQPRLEEGGERARARARVLRGERGDRRLGRRRAAAREQAQALEGALLVGGRVLRAATGRDERERRGGEQRRAEGGGEGQTRPGKTVSQKAHPSCSLTGSGRAVRASAPAKFSGREEIINQMIGDWRPGAGEVSRGRGN
jgi:hypothetical protein